MPRAIIVDSYEILTDEAAHEREAISSIRQFVAQAGVRVPEAAVQQAEQSAVDSFAPNFFEAVIFRLCNRDVATALKVSGQFRKLPVPPPKLRPEGLEILKTCRQLGWKIALAAAPHEEMAKAMQKSGHWGLIDVKGPPAAMKIALPDPRVIEFLVGALGVMPAECLVLGTRMDNDIRPANLLHMTAVQLKQGRYGTRQQPRDLKDVPDYQADDVKALLALLPTIQ
ncbi:MAG: HAD family hydrolase [Planctomycetes bacterium]|jgi:FMN phosphatase YigB (HAD superfamily)|nr:HAD family hydrolase [Planctomycetota bacterium]MCL4731095.1 HAD family hydrolase [Planctomycetota bacterium]